MPQLAPIVLKDGATTPANHTFNPQGIQGSVAALAEAGSVPLADRRLTLGLTRTPNGRSKATVKFVLPVVQDSTGSNGVVIPTQTRAAYVDMTFSFESTSSSQERKDAVAFAQNLLSDAIARGVIVDLQGVY